MVLMRPIKERTEADINVLEKATSFLRFFANIKLMDPQNKFDSHRKCCWKMYHRRYKPGQFVCKYSSLQ